jgi:hypothetical protein
VTPEVLYEIVVSGGEEVAVIVVKDPIDVEGYSKAQAVAIDMRQYLGVSMPSAGTRTCARTFASMSSHWQLVDIQNHDPGERRELRRVRLGVIRRDQLFRRPVNWKLRLAGTLP